MNKKFKFMFIFFAIVLLSFSILPSLVSADKFVAVYKEDANPFIIHNQSTCMGKYILSNGTALMTSTQCLELIKINNKNYVIQYDLK
jgi:hypothetical protein